MGYRSDVYIKVIKENESKLVKILKENNFEAVKEYEDEYYVRYVIYYTKWYDTYMSVNEVNSFIEKDSDGSKGLIVIGEDNNIEEYGSPWSIGMSVVSQIDW